MVFPQPPRNKDFSQAFSVSSPPFLPCIVVAPLPPEPGHVRPINIAMERPLLNIVCTTSGNGQGFYRKHSVFVEYHKYPISLLKQQQKSPCKWKSLINYNIAATLGLSQDQDQGMQDCYVRHCWPELDCCPRVVRNSDSVFAPGRDSRLLHCTPAILIAAAVSPPSHSAPGPGWRRSETTSRRRENRSEQDRENLRKSSRAASGVEC